MQITIQKESYLVFVPQESWILGCNSSVLSIYITLKETGKYTHFTEVEDKFLDSIKQEIKLNWFNFNIEDSVFLQFWTQSS